MLYEKCTDCLHKRIFYNNENLVKIFHKAVDAVNTQKLIQSAVKRENDKLTISNLHYDLNRKVYVVGFGKAVLNMAIEVENILGANLERGICSIPIGQLSIGNNRKMAEESQIEFYEGALNNLPDDAAFNTAKEIFELIKNLEKGDLLIVLISGGGSALLPLPKPPITLEEKQNLIQDLAKKGADIMELNCVRKHLSILKGGGLARLAYPTTVVSLILSDVIGDPIDFIASGPTIPNSDGPGKAFKIIKRYGLEATVSESIKSVLNTKLDDDVTSGIIKTPINTYINVENFIIGNNKIATNAAKAEAIRRGYATSILSLEVSEDVRVLSPIYASICTEIAEVMKGYSTKEYLLMKLERLQEKLALTDEGIDELLDLDFHNRLGVCIILAGETTMKVRGSGKGGRNQHLALQFSLDMVEQMEKSGLIKDMNISLLSCGTDGIDGPTDAAGAIGTNMLHVVSLAQQRPPETFLRNCDSYGFYDKFENGKYLIKIGHTGTNVMDIHVMIINKAYAYEEDIDENYFRNAEFSKSYHC